MTQRPLTPRGNQLPPATKLARLLRTTIDDARRTGLDQRIALAGGAEVVARVRNTAIMLTIKRLGVDVGAVEIKTFCRDAAVPENADRFPLEGQYEWEGWHYLAFKWQEGTS